MVCHGHRHDRSVPCGGEKRLNASDGSVVRTEAVKAPTLKAGVEAADFFSGYKGRGGDGDGGGGGRGQ